MKTQIIFIASLFSTITFASPVIRPEGIFSFSQTRIAQVKDVELVPRQHAARFKELVADGYSCYSADQFYRCSKFIKDVELPSYIQREMEGRFSWKTFSFIRSANAPELINEAESIVEYKIPDSVTYGDETTNDYFYYFLPGSNIKKAMLSFEQDPQWPVIESESELYTPFQKTVNINKFQKRIYELSIYFKKH